MKVDESRMDSSSPSRGGDALRLGYPKVRSEKIDDHLTPREFPRGRKSELALQAPGTDEKKPE